MSRFYARWLRLVVLNDVRASLLFYALHRRYVINHFNRNAAQRGRK